MRTRKRIRPSQAESPASNVVAYSVRAFFAEFKDEEACFTRVMEVRYGHRHVCGKCGKEATFHKLEKRRAYACAQCGDHVYPCAGTIFQDTRTPLQVWFYAIYMFIATRHRISGKELQRTLGVTYKTAWRMGQQIRTLMVNADEIVMLEGHVEVDEAYLGGHRAGKRGRGAESKTILMGMKERGGPIVTKVIPDVKKAILCKEVLTNVEPGSTVRQMS